MKSRGFTLIELLIVVAIIAILAAIAVPNFLEAQTRATIARVRADLRTVATGLAEYQVDNNKYPIDGYGPNDGQAYWYVPGGPVGTKAAGLTSPIAYLNNAKLIDPFRKAEDGSKAKALDLPDSNNFEDIDYCRYRYTNFRYTYMDGRASPLPTYYAAYARVYGDYRLSSSGPDKGAGPSSAIAGSSPAISEYIPYDATNGTVSKGDIIRSEKAGEQPLVGKF